MVAAVVAEEALVRPDELLGPVRAQRLDLLVPPARPPLALEQAGQARGVGRALGDRAHAGAEALGGVAEGVVEQPDLDRPPRPDGFERRRGQLGGQLGAHAPGQQVGPVLRSVQPAHVPVVGIQDHVLARHHVIGGQRERHAAGRGVTGERRDRQVRAGLDDLAHEVVDRVQVPPRFAGGIVGRLDDVEVDAVREEVAAAHQHDDVGLRARGGVAVGLEQPPALVGAHGAVVEVEVQVADAVALVVGDLLERVGGAQADRDLGHVERDAGDGQRAGGGQLERARRLQMRDPHRPVDRGAAHRTMALGDQLAGPAAQRAFGGGRRTDGTGSRRRRRARRDDPRRHGSGAPRWRSGPTPSRSPARPA